MNKRRLSLDYQVINIKNTTHVMATRKGIIFTGLILAAITGASFLLWLIPQESDTIFVISDYAGYLDKTISIHEVLKESINIEYQNLLSGQINSEEYIKVTEVTSVQVTAQISEFITAKPPKEWQSSYISYMEAMREFNSYILETSIHANMIDKHTRAEDMSEIIQNIEASKNRYLEHVKSANESRPDN